MITILNISKCIFIYCLLIKFEVFCGRKNFDNKKTNFSEFQIKQSAVQSQIPVRFTFISAKKYSVWFDRFFHIAVINDIKRPTFMSLQIMLEKLNGRPKNRTGTNETLTWFHLVKSLNRKCLSLSLSLSPLMSASLKSSQFLSWTITRQQRKRERE